MIPNVKSLSDIYTVIRGLRAHRRPEYRLAALQACLTRLYILLDTKQITATEGFEVKRKLLPLLARERELCHLNGLSQLTSAIPQFMPIGLRMAAPVPLPDRESGEGHFIESLIQTPPALTSTKSPAEDQPPTQTTRTRKGRKQEDGSS